MDVHYCPGGYPLDIHFCPSDIHWRSYGYPSETLLDVQWISIPDIHRMYRNVRWICNGYPLKEIWISTYWNMDIHWTFNSINQHKHCAPTHQNCNSLLNLFLLYWTVCSSPRQCQLDWWNDHWEECCSSDVWEKGFSWKHICQGSTSIIIYIFKNNHTDGHYQYACPIKYFEIICNERFLH